MKIGSIVKSLDFAHIETMFVIGVVKDIDHATSTIVLDVIECSEGYRVGQEVVTAMQGHNMMDFMGERVTVIQE
jgi:hypothetical protein